MKFQARAYSFVCFLPVCLFYCAAANADMLVMKNGDRITGEISRIWDKEVTIEPAYSDEFEVEIESVEYIESDRKFEIDLIDGQSLLATFGGADADGNQIIQSDDESVSLPLTELFELEEPEDPFEWESNVGISLDINKGNTDTENGQIRADTMVRFNDHRHFGEVTLSREEVTDPTTNVRSTTKEQDIFRYNYNFLFNDPWFFASSFTFERDPISELESRVIISAGIGRDVWNTPRRSLSVQLGAGFQQEELGSNATDSTVTTDSTVATWTLRYRQDLFGDDVGVFHNQSITHNITGRTNTSYRTSTGLSYELTDLLTSNISLDFDYQTDPAEGAENEDLTLMFGLALEFE